MLVPSALAVNENNWLINPQHPEFKQIAVNPLEPLRYDARMFRRKSAAETLTFFIGCAASLFPVSL